VAEVHRIGALGRKQSAPTGKAGFDLEVVLACVHDIGCAGLESGVFNGWEGGTTSTFIL
jgi:hypothetical protein